MIKSTITVFFSLITLFVVGQTTFPVNGSANPDDNYYVFRNATIYVDHETVLEKAVLVIKDGKIVVASDDVDLDRQEGSFIVYNMKGKTIYPSFVDPYSKYGIAAEPKRERQRTPQMISKKDGSYGWNEAIRAEYNAVEHFKVDDKAASELRKLGFGAVLSHQMDGVVRGTGTAVLLGTDVENKVVLNNYASAHLSFKKGSSRQGYPSSQMGSIALLRQTYLDAFWHASEKNDEANLSLTAFNQIQALPQIFETSNYLEVLRADKIGDEFDVQYIFKGSGDEYKRMEKVKASGAAFILPVNFPKAYSLDDPYGAEHVTVGDMKHWEYAPANPAIMEQFEVPFSFTAHGLKDKKAYLANIRKSVEFGLSKGMALKAMTFNPALLLGFERKVGALRSGMVANFIITSGDIFDKETVIYENWIAGKKYVVKNPAKIDVRGKYDVNVGGRLFELEVAGSADKLKATVSKDSTKYKSVLTQDDGLVSLRFNVNDSTEKGVFTLSAKINFDSGSWDGQGQDGNGKWVDWSAIRTKKHEKKDKPHAQDSLVLGGVWYPNMAYGWDSMPAVESVVYRDATVWTNEKEGIIKGCDVHMANGKIVAVGVDLTVPAGTAEVDASNKHITSGIIDEHSHIAISKGVNEGTQAVTAEVSIADVVNSDDVNIYRQLSGGVTAAQLLHGSANPVGGQSAIIKLRWGASPEEMKIANADGFIKFALGENVKQSNWGSYARVRFPQTRMGVEQVYYDAFTRAKAYEREWGIYHSLKDKVKEKTTPPRKDLELDALVEILNSKRFISCHSYIQSEINMLMHVADSMGFRVNTFTHILEGYKLADKMKAHGAGGSTFSDWWAYKYEVHDAIPYNGAIMHEQGVVTAYNSDDAEMARRLNQEAAKAVKYGGVSEEEAWKFVTLNPAKLLHLDGHMGSLKSGKDADIVVWSGHPMSIYSKAERTYIDGVRYFDIVRDVALRQQITDERVRLTQKMLLAKKKGEETQKPKPKKQRLYHCDSEGE